MAESFMLDLYFVGKLFKYLFKAIAAVFRMIKNVVVKIINRAEEKTE